ncbi:MAG TPA: flagellin [Caulobacterales bacterium]|nr:flagellin [Caulobacterales bacterium]
MSQVSVNTNYGALLALQSLNKTNQELGDVQNRINTGFKVATAKDNGATFAIAQAMRGKVAGYGVAKDTLDKAISTVDVTLAAGNTLSDLLNEMKQKATAARDPSLTTAQRAAFNADFVQLRAAITRTVANAEFNGANMIKAGGSNVVAFANDTGSSLITLTAVSFALSGSTVTVTTTDQVDTYTNAGLALTHVNASITALNKQLATLGSGSRALEKHRTFLAQLSDSLEAGIGNLVDADMAKESAKLQSLQVKQQLGAQALSIANQSPQILLKFFGG